MVRNYVGYTETFFAQLLSEQRVLRFSREGFARYECWKERGAHNEALDLACYNRAALEYLKVRLEQIRRDVIARMNPDSVERIETGLGQSILVQRQTSKGVVPRRSPHRTHFTKIEGLETESEANVQWTGSAAQGMIPKPQKDRYGAVGQSF